MTDRLLIIPVYVTIVFIAWWLTGRIRVYALDRSILDHPNHRSLHEVPMPRGGGIAISLSVLISVLVLYLTGMLSLKPTLALGAGGLLVAITGWLDDNRDVPILARSIAYLLASVWACFWLLETDFKLYPLMVFIVWSVAIAWLLNLYNFMDGSDGLAALQAVCTAGMAGLLLLNAGQYGLSLLALTLSAASAGFLIWNWPPARIFMGDVGSCLTGFVFAVLALITWVEGGMSLAVWMILLAIFIIDASLTLLKRMASGDIWYKAHRQHAYQVLIQMGMSHKQLNYGVLLINLLFLLPLSYLAAQFELYGWWLAGIVYLSLAGMWLIIQLKYRNSRINAV